MEQKRVNWSKQAPRKLAAIYNRSRFNVPADGRFRKSPLRFAVAGFFCFCSSMLPLPEPRPRVLRPYFRSQRALRGYELKWTNGHPREAAMRSDAEYLRLAVEIATESRASGNQPFGALLVGPEGDVLLSSGNTSLRDRLGHAEINVARAAAQQYDPRLSRAMHAGDLGRAVLHVRRGLLLGWYRHRHLRMQRKAVGRADRRQPPETSRSELSPGVRRPDGAM